MSLTWKPERAGNWLFHCHIMHHVSPDRRLSDVPASATGHHAQHDPGMGMAGLVMGITVVGAEESKPSATLAAAPRRMTLTMRPDPKQGDRLAYGFSLTEGNERSANPPLSIPGPTLVLQRGEPVEIALVNELPEATAVHWHGMELDSYYDGVHGWSGAGAKVTPMIEPGATFVVRFTPPRTGTFIYHTHLHDYSQLTDGLYGAMLVVDSAESKTAFDPATDHVFVIGGGSFAIGGTDEAVPPLLNGETRPRFVWKAGAKHRVRLINITTDDIFLVSLQTAEGPVIWRPLTKDGAPLPPDRCAPGPARQVIAVGETYDFEYEAPAGRQNLWLEVRTTGGKWQVQGMVMVR
jgi:FtsP/CotA-like multicopper oxidase with cupredoxin domain